MIPPSPKHTSSFLLLVMDLCSFHQTFSQFFCHHITCLLWLQSTVAVVIQWTEEQGHTGPISKQLQAEVKPADIQWKAECFPPKHAQCWARHMQYSLLELLHVFLPSSSRCIWQCAMLEKCLSIPGCGITDQIINLAVPYLKSGPNKALAGLTRYFEIQTGHIPGHIL